MIYIVTLTLPNEKPGFRVVGVFRDRDSAQLAGEREAEDAGNDAAYEITQDDGKDLDAKLELDTVGKLEILARLEAEFFELERRMNKAFPNEGPAKTVAVGLAEIYDSACQGSNQSASDDPGTIWSDEELERFITILSAGNDLLEIMMR